MFKKSRRKALVEYASEEDDMAWHYEHSYKSPGKEAIVKKTKSKKDKREKKMFSSKDDEHFLLTGVKLADRRRSHTKIKEEEKEKQKDKPEKSYCFWESVTMTLRQVTPTRKPEKMEGWEPPRLGDEGNDGRTDCDGDHAAPEAVGKTGDPPGTPSPPQTPPQELPPGLAPWTGLGPEEDSSHYANLPETSAARWTDLAKVKLAGISRRGRGIVSENSWKGFK
ncbi:hypothetical protein NHX12_026584 [Muraenolepis orangiensis]|uniref:Uncharacterized protein n=1 Tax=Muraenolepis orangiensis TaxID=630683 RepID=A0A9Q0EGV5_9TELE|nr:hypothetical protein NHX12_026584 [Muraenolepis orangiensis]